MKRAVLTMLLALLALPASARYEIAVADTDARAHIWLLDTDSGNLWFCIPNPSGPPTRLCNVVNTGIQASGQDRFTLSANTNRQEVAVLDRETGRYSNCRKNGLRCQVYDGPLNVPSSGRVPRPPSNLTID